MKLKNLKIQNFAKFTDFEIEFDGKITNLVGLNGSGKTTIGLTAIWAALRGISENKKNGQLVGERFRFIGPKKATADIELTILDGDVEIKVSNHISKSTNKITFDAPDGYEINDAWVNNLLSVAFISAKNFSGMNTRDQALLLGMDTEKHDEKIKELKTDFTLLNRDLKAFGLITLGEKKEKVSVTELIAEKDKLVEFNNEQNALLVKDANANELLFDLQQQAKEAKADLEKAQSKLEGIVARIKTGEEVLGKMEKAKEKKPTDEINAKIASAEKDNEDAAEYERKEKQLEEKKQSQKLVDENKENQDAAIKERLDYISSFDFSLDGLSVDEKGGLLLNDKPVKEPYFSKGELELIVAGLHASINPDLKVRFIDDFESLDEDNQNKILESLFEKDFQVITAIVAKESKRENSVLLRECKMAGDKIKDKII